MVGVPRSKGCATCRNRRIKVSYSFILVAKRERDGCLIHASTTIQCDEARPECGQCQRYGCPCPGYNRKLKFQDEGPNLQRRHRRMSDRKPNDAEKKPSPESSSSSSAVIVANLRNEIPEVMAEDAFLLMRNHAGSIDESLSPSLVQKLFMSQQPRLFMDFTCAAFPTLYFHNRFRSDLAFPEYMMKNFRKRAYQDSAVCCLSAVYLASLTKDIRLLRTSRHMYGEALQRLNRIIDTDEAFSDDVLSTVMMLTVYELYARTTPDAWVKHARGVREIFLRRGAQRHMSGLGRSCYYAFRGFLVAHAMHEGIPCFLDEEEWQNFAIKVQEEDAKKPSEWSVFVHISEMIFMEMVKCPRYIHDIRQLSPNAPRQDVTSLVSRIRATCANLRSLGDDLRASIMYHFQKKEGIEVNEDGFVGPAPALFPDTNPTLLLQGATHCVNTLEKLLRTIKIDSLHIKYVDEESAETTPPPSLLPSSPSTANNTEAISATFSPTPSVDSTCETISSTNSSPRPADGITDPTKTASFTLPFRLVSEISRGPVHHDDNHHSDKSAAGYRPVVWLDHIACSMGMIRSDIEEEQQAESAGLETITEIVEVVEE
jgi:Fungal specific transcription factor domain